MTGSGTGRDEKKRRLLEIVKAKSFRTGTITLASGRTSNFYFDMKPSMFDPEAANLMAELILDRLSGESVDFLGGLEMGAVPVVVSVVQKSRDYGPTGPVPGFFVRKEAKRHGTRRLIEGVSDKALAGKAVVVLEDVATTGGSALKAVKAAREEGADVRLVVTIVDRGEGAAEALRAEGIELAALLTAEDFGVSA